MAARIVCDEPRTCALCSCTETMACIERDGQGCSWSTTNANVCTACDRVWAVTQAMTPTQNGFAILREACRLHRERGYANG